jgi:hypothetical protein
MALAGQPATTTIVDTTACSLPGAAPLSAELVGTIAFPQAGGLFHFNCAWSGTTLGFVWIDGHLVCQDGHAYQPSDSTTDNPLPVNTVTSTKGVVTSLPFRAHIYSNGSAHEAGVNVTWAVENEDQMLTALSHVVIPAAALAPNLPAAEQQRDELQRGLATGWGSWLHGNMLPVVKLPEAAVLTAAICSISTGKCIDSCVPDGARPYATSKAGGVETRVGLHAFTRSYVQFYFGGGSGPHHSPNISFEYSASAGGGLEMLLTPQDSECGGNCSDWQVQLRARYAWLKAGSANATQTKTGAAIEFTPAGLPPLTVHSASCASAVVVGSVPGASAAVTVALGNGPVGFSSSAAATVATITATLAAAKATEEALLVKTFGVERAGEGQAIKAAVMWNLHSTPAENGGAPLLPVSRVWGTRGLCPTQVTCSYGVCDFAYVVFGWDNVFASLLAATGAPTTVASTTGVADGFGIAVSNLFQVVKAKTAAGFIANYAAGGKKSQDRSEPPVGAKVLLDLVRKFGADRMKWVVAALFNDLLDANDWVERRRLVPALNLVALGAYNEQTGEAGNMQDARYESGLDNSPMYDGEFFNRTSGLMNLYDVGMSSLFAQEAFALAELAPLADKPSSMADLLNARGKVAAAKISEHLWHEELGIFVNRFSENASFYEHVSPTSFYALAAKAATDEQAARMAEGWLMNKTRFCIAPEGDHAGLDDTCYWGLPSIAASDAAYPALGYWRGYVWGPMAQLTYGSLQQYDHVPSVRTARKALAKQMGSLMMSQWSSHHHICENYNPAKTADTTGGDCSGTRFYHWGALTGLIGLMEDGLF